MTNVVIVSFFRNSARKGHLVPFFKQVRALREALGDKYHTRLVAVEGDSDDRTITTIETLATQINISLSMGYYSHGLREFGSTEHPTRLYHLSRLGNVGLSMVKESDDVVLYVESDLIWDASTIVKLLDHNVDMVSPLVFAGDNFYDVFCYRDLQGNRFSPFPPYSSSLLPYGLTEVSSVGSCIVMKAVVARNCRIPEGEVLIGFCARARESGYHIYVDPLARVNHPV
jgi:glycosyltransferase involved in cell wall biosynthesis